MTDQVRDAYDGWAETYDEMPNLTRDLDAVLLRRDLSGRDLGDVLELGCGTGKNTRWLMRHAQSVIGLDLSPGMLARCRQRVDGVDARQADLTERWPLEDRSVDVVLADLVLEHVQDLEHVAREAARVLRPGGGVRLAEFHPRRQQEGKAARFDDGEGQEVRPTAFVHSTDSYVGAFYSAGFAFEALAEPRHPDDELSRPPRLLVLEFSLPGEGS